MNQNTTSFDNSNPQQGGDVRYQPGTNTHSKGEGGSGSRKEFNPSNVEANIPRPAYADKAPRTRKDPRKLFIGGLPTDVTEHEFRTYFQEYGEVIDSVVMFDRETRRSRGFGFVTFKDPETSKHILQMGSQPDGTARLQMRGKTCEVKAAEPKESAPRPRRGVGAERGYHDQRYNMPSGYYFGPVVGAPPPGQMYGDSRFTQPKWPQAPEYAPVYYPPAPGHPVPVAPVPGFVVPHTPVLPVGYYPAAGYHPTVGSELNHVPVAQSQYPNPPCMTPAYITQVHGTTPQENETDTREV